MESNRKYMKGELPTFSDCAKYVEGKAIPGDFVPERDDGENQEESSTHVGAFLEASTYF